MKKEKLYPLAKARTAAHMLAAELTPFCHKIDVAGSVRRGSSPNVHDIDLVAWPIYNDTASTNLFGEIEAKIGGPDLLLARLRWLGTDPGDPAPEALILHCNYQGIPVEIYLANHDGENYGALLQMRTGSKEFNLRLISIAARLGLTYKAGYGIWRDGRRVDDGSERGIFTALGLEYVEPELRSGALPLRNLARAK